jgi:hypothetical protein
VRVLSASFTRCGNIPFTQSVSRYWAMPLVGPLPYKLR